MRFSLWLESEAYHEVSLLRTWVGCHLSKDRNREAVGDIQVLGCLYCYVGHSEARGI